jgi:hypothetical protein
MSNSQPYGQKQMTPYEEDIVQDTLREFSQMQTVRNIFAVHWEEVAELILPTQRNTFMFGNYNAPGQKKTDRQVDATGMLALSRFSAICDSLLTPSNSYWHGLEADNDYVMKDRATRLWYEQATRALFKFRYMPEANFISQNQAKYQSIGAFGNTGLFIDALDPAVSGKRGLRYKAVPLGELFFHENHQGAVDGFVRWFRMTARQAKQKWPDTFPAVLQTALEANSEQLFDFLHRVCLRTDYDSDRLDVKGKRFASYYVCIQSKTLLQEGGYRSFPMDVLRYDQSPGEVYARAPAMLVLPALKTLNAEKRTFLKQGHRAADPVLLTYDDGLLSFDLTPGAQNGGGMTSEGKPLVGVLPTGNIQTSKEMMDEERTLINDAFLVTLFQILTETPTMSATEVIERTNEKGILLAPTVGRLRPDTMIDREIDLLLSMDLLPPMPPRMREAAKAGALTHSTTHTSPLSKAMQAQEAAGFFRTLEGLKEIVAVTGDHSILDPFDFDAAGQGIARIQSVRESWMSDDKAIASKRKVRADAAQRQEMIQAAPAAAAMAKARAMSGAQGQGGGGSPAAPAQAPAQAGPSLTQA